MANKVGAIEFDVDVDSSGLVSGNAKIVQSNEAVEQSFRDIDKASADSTKNFTSNSQKAGKQSKQTAYAFGQMGNQVADLAVQLEMGTNPLRAFTQQGSQAAAMFGPTGMVVGAVLATAGALIGQLVPGLFSANEEFDKMYDKVKELSDKTKLSADEAKFLAMMEKQSTEEKKKLREELQGQLAEMDAVLDSTDKTNTAMQNLGQGMSVAGGMAGMFGSMLNDASTAQDDAAKKAALLRAQISLLNREIAGDNEKSQKRSNEVKALEDRVRLLQVYSDRELSIQKEKTALGAINSDSSYSQQLHALALYYDEREIAISKREAGELTALEAALEEKRLKYANDKEMLQLLEQEHQLQINAISDIAMQQRIQMAQDEADAKNKIAEAEARQKLQLYSSMFGNLSQLMNSESRKMFEVGKAAALAGAIVDGIAAVQGSYKAGAKIGGPPLGAIYAATSAAATLANIQQIKATKFGSANAAAGQSYSGGVVASNQVQQSSRQDISISVTGGDDAGRALMDIIRFQVQNGNSLPVGG